MIPQSAGLQPDEKAKQFAQSYAGKVEQMIQAAIDARTERHPLFTGQSGTTIADRKDYYV